MKTVFLGNHTVGVEALGQLLRHPQVEVVGVVAHPEDPEDGVVYRSVHAFASEEGLPVIRGRARDEEVGRFVEGRQPDLIWVTDYRYLLPREVIDLAPLGAVNLHPSLLPAYRGRAPINWAIIHGESRLGLTCHWIDDGVDTGNIIEQLSYSLADHEDVGDALTRLYPLYREITRLGLDKICAGKAEGTPQIVPPDSPVFPGRKPDDGLVSWEKSGREIVNLIRAVARPYPGAFSLVNGGRVMFWKAALSSRPCDAPPGTVCAVDEEGALLVSSADVGVLVREYEVRGVEDSFLRPGFVFQPGGAS